MNKLIFTEWEGQILTALWTDGTITRLSLEEQESPSLLNRIYVGKVKNVVKNINAAFVEIQDGIIGYQVNFLFFSWSVFTNPKPGI